MITFLDGPAANESLGVRRAPTLLRVVRSRTGKWDALDQPEDVPLPSEKITVYRRVARAVRLHIKASKKELRGWWENAPYRLHEQQPPDDVARDNEQWVAWCRHQCHDNVQILRDAGFTEQEITDALAANPR